MSGGGTIPFHLPEDEYDGLQEGSDGEFYFKQKKKRRKLTKDQKILGIFGPDEDDSDSDERGKKRGKKINYTGATVFKSAGATEASELNNTFHAAGSSETKKEKDERLKAKMYTLDDLVSSDSDVEVPPSSSDSEYQEGGGLSSRPGLGNHDRNAQPVDAEDMNKTITFKKGDEWVTEKADEVEVKSDSDSSVDERFKFKDKTGGPVQGPKLQKRVDISEHAMEQKYGKGFKFLKKLGWQGGGLGKEGEGIANPLQSLLRTRNQGISADDKGVNDNVDGYIHQKPKTGIDILLGSEESRQAEKMKREIKKQADGWKKDSKPKPKREEYVTAKEIRQDTPQVYVIRDMTGPQERILTSLEGAFGFGSSGLEFGRMKELKLNIRRLIDDCERDLTDYEKEKIKTEEKITSLEDEISGKVPKKPRMPSSDIENIRISLKECTKKNGFRNAMNRMEKLRKAFPDAMNMKDVKEICLCVISPLVRNEISKKPGGILHNKDDVFTMLDDIETTLDVTGDDVWILFLRDVLVDQLRREFSTWNVRHLTGIELYDKMKGIMPNPILLDVISNSIIPRLIVEIERWNIVHELTVNTWVHPWIEHIPTQQLQQVFDTVHRKIIRWLGTWNMENPMILLRLLRPWKLVFNESQWKIIITRLRRRLKHIPECVVRRTIPSRENPVELAEALFVWSEYWGVEEFQEALEDKVFQPWLRTLRVWLEDDDIDFKDVIEWVKGWRSLMPKIVLSSPYVEDTLNYGLKVTKHFMTGGDAPLPPPRTVNIAKPDDSDYIPPTDRLAESVRVQRVEDVTMNIKDVLEEIAGEENILMMPTKHRSDNGKQLHKFGKALIFWDSTIVYCQTKAGKFIPLVLDELTKVGKGIREIPP